jgi:hypothetical protein
MTPDLEPDEQLRALLRAPRSPAPSFQRMWATAESRVRLPRRRTRGRLVGSGALAAIAAATAFVVLGHRHAGAGSGPARPLTELRTDGLPDLPLEGLLSLGASEPLPLDGLAPGAAL